MNLLAIKSRMILQGKLQRNALSKAWKTSTLFMDVL